MKQMTVFGAKEIDEIKDISIAHFMRELDKFKFGESLIEVYPVINNENKVNIEQKEFDSINLNKYFKGYMTKNKKVQIESIVNLYKNDYLSLIIELKTGKVYQLKDKGDKNEKPYLMDIYSKKKKGD